MTRAIAPSMASILEELELAGDEIVTMRRLDDLVRAAGLRTSARVVAARLRHQGWLLDTGQRGVWEFAPASVAGPYSRGGPTLGLRALLARRNVACGLTFHAAAWALNAADRVPSRVEVAVAHQRDVEHMPDSLSISVFAPHVPYLEAKGVPCLGPASVLTHMATSPNRVRSWSSAAEWLPDLAADAQLPEVLAELEGRPATVHARLGYLLQGLRPDIASEIVGPSTKTWFGPRRPTIRHDSVWQIADSLLPFDPRSLEPVT
ncbi:hypothetical protein BH09ACT8_BH09ACT8_31020 [soil metagenome]